MESFKICFQSKGNVVTKTEDVPQPTEGQLLIRSRKTLISTGTECIALNADFEAGTNWDKYIKFPMRPGYCNAGEVVAIGEGVADFKPGDRVATRQPHEQYFLVDQNAAVPIPDDIPDEDAAWFGIACIVQVGVRHAQHEMGDKVAVVGLGVLGQLAVQYARAMGASEVIAIDTSAERLRMASNRGATRTLQMTALEAETAVEEITEGRMADVVYEVTGHWQVLPQALKLARRFGKIILLGDSGFPSKQCLTQDVVVRGLKILGAHDGNAPGAVTDHTYWTQRNMARLFFTYLQRGQMHVNDLITHRFNPREAVDVYKMLSTDRSKAVGVQFDWTLLD